MGVAWLGSIELGTWESLVLGMRCKDGIILAGTKKISYGYLVISQIGRAVEVIDNIGFAFSGHVADLQSLLKEIKMEMNYLKYTLGRPLTISAIANRLGLILYSWKLFPYITFALVGGYDKIPEEKPRLYSLDPVGSVIEEDYAASGVSAEVAIGLLEDRYHKDITVEEAQKLAVDAMKAVARRDVLAGRYIDIAIIKKDSSELKTVTLEV